MTAKRLIGLSPREGRQAVLRTVGRVVGAWAGLLVLYWVLPLERPAAEVGVQLVGGLLALSAVVVWQIRRIARARLPHLQAFEALGVLVPVYVVVFAGTYLTLSTDVTASFSEVLDHTSALYFTVTILATVGFGDITPVTSLARGIVTAQMLITLVFAAFVVRVIFAAANRTYEIREREQASEPPSTA